MNPSQNPLFWVGGKQRIAKTIISLFPPKGTVRNYVEVFGGAAHVLFQLDPAYCGRETYCDVDGDLVNFFNVVRQDPEEFMLKCELVPYSRECWFDWKNHMRRDNKGEELDPMERAVRFFYVLRAAFAGNINGSGGSWAHTATGDNWKPRNFRNAVEKVRFIAERFANVQIDDRSYELTIPHYDAPDTLFFGDPPYWESAANTGYYMHDFTDADHYKLAELCNAASGFVLLTYYEFDQVRDMYPPDKWTYTFVDTKTSCLNKTAETRDHDKSRTELILTNYDPKG